MTERVMTNNALKRRVKNEMVKNKKHEKSKTDTVVEVQII